MLLKISNSSVKRCREKFRVKGIGKLIHSALMAFDLLSLETIISECIYDSDNPRLYNVFLYLIRENCKDGKIINELDKFEYKTI